MGHEHVVDRARRIRTFKNDVGTSYTYREQCKCGAHRRVTTLHAVGSPAPHTAVGHWQAGRGRK